MLFIYYPKCSTCQKGKKYLDELNLKYEERIIKVDKIDFDELKSWYELSGLDLKKFFNTSGLVYKELNLKDKFNSFTEDELLTLLSNNPMLIKRPLLIHNDLIIPGFKLDLYNKLKEN